MSELENQTNETSENQEDIVVETSETPESKDVTEQQPEEEKPKGKPSRWIGLICIVAFVVMGGLSGGSVWMWIIFGILVLLTLAGDSKLGQLVLGAILFIFFLPDSDDSSSYNGDSSYSTEYNSGSSSGGQTAAEKAKIERMFDRIEGLKRSFDDAVKYGLPEYRQKQLSDEAWQLHNELEEMNLTHEQRVRLSKLFAL